MKTVAWCRVEKRKRVLVLDRDVVYSPVVHTGSQGLVLLHKEEPCSHRRRRRTNEPNRQRLGNIVLHGLPLRLRQVVQLGRRQGSTGQQVNCAVIRTVRGQGLGPISTKYLLEVMVNGGNSREV